MFNPKIIFNKLNILDICTAMIEEIYKLIQVKFL